MAAEKPVVRRSRDRFTCQSPTRPVARGFARGRQRMLAAIVLQADKAWFFKAVGPDAQMAEQADAFRSLLRSVRFVDEKPQWTLPDGWRQKAESGMRFATLEFGPADQPLELTVIPLGIPPGEPSAYVLSNVNRWRQQLNLPPIAAAELDQQTEKIELDGDDRHRRGSSRVRRRITRWQPIPSLASINAS